ncbi:hypothetical protein NK6_8715 [Bradyrhizobium diazoefficiens]|uniref:Uncharacterized protein n=1 Tax=Bradyrhizobium diazoefficiens TaxID=1355477 RepID=A0A0E4FYC5_9BRAD|nr:hypothetical protein NK6_8715 [Bradyrhizobium diazoefficiens]
MKRILKYEQTVTFDGEVGEKLRVSYDNRGDHYRQGVSLWLESGSTLQGVFIDENEVRRLQDLFELLYPRKQRR